MQRRAVIVATARTPIGRAGRGAFNETYPQTLASHAIQHALSRSGLEPERIDDVILGAAMQVGANGGNVARQSLLLAGLPDSVPGMCIDRACSSGLMAIATAAKQIIVDGETAVIAGGVESISLVRADYLNASHRQHPVLLREMPAIYMSMLETAEIVAANHHISREAQDEFALQSQQRTARAQAEGRFDDEIVALTTVMSVTDPETQQLTKRTVTLSQDEGNRPDTTLAGLAALKPVLSDGQRIRRGATVTAGNASQLSDGASVCVLMDSLEAEKRGIEPLGAYLGMAVAGCDPAELLHLFERFPHADEANTTAGGIEDGVGILPA